MFYVKVRDLETRNRVIEKLYENGVMAVFHYIPLHTSPAGRKFGCFHGEDIYTTKESERLLRLPLFFGLARASVDKITSSLIQLCQIGSLP
jgi:dTDP-4-amino-4,6-dideoxygalactose transaminase